MPLLRDVAEDLIVCGGCDDRSERKVMNTADTKKAAAMMILGGRMMYGCGVV